MYHNPIETPYRPFHDTRGTRTMSAALAFRHQMMTINEIVNLDGDLRAYDYNWGAPSSAVRNRLAKALRTARAFLRR